MKLNPKPASRKGQTMRTLIFGLSGSGKTLYALEAAKTLTDGDMSRVLVIDTENESSGLYADDYQFMLQPWEGAHHPTQLASLIRQADQSPDFDVIIIDGASPFWDGQGGVLDIVEQANKRNPKAFNWTIGTAAQNELMQQILDTKKHLIVTCRGKNFTPDDSDAALAEIKVKPVQRDTFFYEFNTAVYVHPDHSSEIVKTRCKGLHKARFAAQDGASQYASTEKAWLADNSKYVDAVTVDKIKGYFADIPEGEPRRLAKEDFVAKFGAPDHMEADKADEARAYAKGLVAQFKEADSFLDDSFLDEEVIQNG